MIAVLLIGDELLSGQIHDRNLKYMQQVFSISGHQISEVRIVGDKIDKISNAVKELSMNHTYVITSGGVGPTHDDVTVASIASAFNQKLLRNTLLETSLRDFYKSEITDEALTMADIPEKSELIDMDGKNWPILKVENCYVLPGVPQFFQQKFDRLLNYLPVANPYYIARIFVYSDESFFAKKLTQVNQDYHPVLLGSYPIFGDPTYNTEITIKHENEELVQEVFDVLEQFFKKSETFRFSKSPIKSS